MKETITIWNTRFSKGKKLDVNLTFCSGEGTVAMWCSRRGRHNEILQGMISATHISDTQRNDAHWTHGGNEFLKQPQEQHAIRLPLLLVCQKGLHVEQLLCFLVLTLSTCINYIFWLSSEGLTSCYWRPHLRCLRLVAIDQKMMDLNLWSQQEALVAPGPVTSTWVCAHLWLCIFSSNDAEHCQMSDKFL